MNWRTKVLIQFTLAHAPKGEQVNHRLQWFSGRYEPGRMRLRVIEQAASFLNLFLTFTME